MSKKKKPLKFKGEFFHSGTKIYYHRKSWAGNLLMLSDLTLGPYFKVKRRQPYLKVLIIRLLLVVDVCNVKPTFGKSCAGYLVRFDLGPFLQGQTRTAKLKSAYNLLIIGPRGLQCEPT